MFPSAPRGVVDLQGKFTAEQGPSPLVPCMRSARTCSQLPVWYSHEAMLFGLSGHALPRDEVHKTYTIPGGRFLLRGDR